MKNIDSDADRLTNILEYANDLNTHTVDTEEKTPLSGKKTWPPA